MTHSERVYVRSRVSIPALFAIVASSHLMRLVFMIIVNKLCFLIYITGFRNFIRFNDNLYVERITCSLSILKNVVAMSII